MKSLPYEVICNGITVAYVENPQLAKVLTSALLDNVTNLQNLSVNKIEVSAVTPEGISVPVVEG